MIAGADSSPGPSATARAVRFEGETTDGRRVTLPDDERGRPLVVIVGFTRNSGDAVRRWSDALQADAGTRTAVYGVALIDGVPGFIRGFVRKAIDKNVGPPHAGKAGFVTTTEGRTLRATVPPGGNDDPAIYVFAADGSVRSVERAAFSAEAETRIEEAIP